MRYKVATMVSKFNLVSATELHLVYGSAVVIKTVFDSVMAERL